MNPTTQFPTNSVYPARQQLILRLPEVKAKTGFSRRTIYALMANVEFPRSIRIGARAVGCLEAISTSGLKLAVSVPLMAVDKHQFQTHYLPVRCIVTRQHYSSLVLNWLRYLTQNSEHERSVFQNARQRFLARLPAEADD